MREDGPNGGENVGGDLRLRAHDGARFVEARNDGPVGAAGKLIVHGGGVFEMAKTGFLNVFFFGGVGARRFAGDEKLGLARRNAKIKDEGFAGKLVNVVFEMLDPGDESVALGGGNAGSLVGQIGADVAVREHDFAFG